MGRDKAFLPAPPFRSLLERQINLLATLAPCEQLISARYGQSLPAEMSKGGRARVVNDDGTCGPLGGLVAVLRAARAPRVLVLGVDVALMDAPLLRRIVGAAPVDYAIGVVPRMAMTPQPLAALWPRTMLAMAEAQLATGVDFSLRVLVASGVAAGCLRWFDVPSWDEPRFANWNRPTDVQPARR